jgi:DNA-binding response OmpR family regulator
MGKTTVLLIEGKYRDDSPMARLFKRWGFGVTSVNTLREVRVALANVVPDMVVYDTPTMRSNGRTVCNRVRLRLPDVPIVYCQLNNEEVMPGVTASLPFPATPRQVLNRVRALLSASEEEEGPVYRAGDLVLYEARRTVRVAGEKEVVLTPRLVQLLARLMVNPGEVLKRGVLMQDIWETTYLGDTRTLDVHIRWLREAIEDDPGTPRRLLTVRGEGYRLVAIKGERSKSADQHSQSDQQQVE